MVMTPAMPVGNIAVGFPTAIPTLDRLGANYCCHGQHTLVEASTKRRPNLAPVLEKMKCCGRAGTK